MKLDLGWGGTTHDDYEDYETVDLDPSVSPDHVVDLAVYPWPWPNDSVTAAYSSHLVEHIVDLVGFMRELYRVMKDGAEVVIRHPYQFHVSAWQDPTHVRALNEISWFYYDKRQDISGRADFDGIDFEVTNIEAIPDPAWARMADEHHEEFERAAKTMNNVVFELIVTLTCVK